MRLKHPSNRKFFFTTCLVTGLVVGCQDQKKLPETEPPQAQTSPAIKADDVKNNFSAPVEITEQEEETVHGTYIYDGSDVKCKISVFEDNWIGSFTIVSGFGDDYDASQAEFQSGVVRGKEIFDESGFVKIGTVDGKILTTTVGGRYISLKRKN